jgi:DNA-binding Lrp family transcriptional regulator
MRESWREPGYDAGLDETDRRILDTLQDGFPLCERPYAEAARTLGLDEAELLARLQTLLSKKALTRFGPLFQIERLGGIFVLAAMCVPEADWARTVEAVNALPEVAHNYRREHALNMWFVLAAGTQEGIEQAVARIEAETGLSVLCFPKEKEYFVEMKLPVRSRA